jgi:hypothetical protein
VNLSCKILEDYLKTRPSSHKERIVTLYAISIYFHALLLYAELKDDSDYDKIFKKCMSAAARATLPVLDDTYADAILQLLKMATPEAFAGNQTLSTVNIG